MLITANPIAIPNDDTDINIFRPALSIRNVQQIAPRICIIPTIIEDTLREKDEPDYSKMAFAKFIIEKHPQNWLRAIKRVPYAITLSECLEVKSVKEIFLDEPSIDFCIDCSSISVSSDLSKLLAR